MPPYNRTDSTLTRLLASGMMPPPDPTLAVLQEAAAKEDPLNFLNGGNPTNATPAKISASPVPPRPQLPMANQSRVIGDGDWDKLQSRQLEGLEQQKKGVGDMEEYFRTYLQNKKPQLDLTPLMNLADQLSGGKSMAGYKPTEDPTDKAFALKDAILKQRNAVSDKEIDLLKAQVSANQNRGLLGALNQSLKKEDTLRKDIDKAVLEPISKRAEQFANIDDAFATGDYSQIRQILAQFARGVSGEKGVLTEEDIKRVIPRSLQGDLAQFWSYFGNNQGVPTAALDPEFTASLREAIDRARRNASIVYGGIVNDKRKTYGSGGAYSDMMAPGAVGDNILKVAEERVKSFVPEREVKSAQAPGGAPAGIMSVDEFMKSQQGK